MKEKEGRKKRRIKGREKEVKLEKTRTEEKLLKQKRENFNLEVLSQEDNFFHPCSQFWK